MKTEQTQNTVEKVVENFYNSIDSFDEENSLLMYDKALLQDVISVIRRIENMRKRAGRT